MMTNFKGFWKSRNEILLALAQMSFDGSRGNEIMFVGEVDMEECALKRLLSYDSRVIVLTKNVQ